MGGTPGQETDDGVQSVRHHELCVYLASWQVFLRCAMQITLSTYLTMFGIPNLRGIIRKCFFHGGACVEHSAPFRTSRHCVVSNLATIFLMNLQEEIFS